MFFHQYDRPSVNTTDPVSIRQTQCQYGRPSVNTADPVQYDRPSVNTADPVSIRQTQCQYGRPSVTPTYMNNRHMICLLTLLHFCIANRKIHKYALLVNSSFCLEADENCANVGYYAASSCNLLATFRGNLSAPSPRVKIPK
jgi:hypothetical protein